MFTRYFSEETLAKILNDYKTKGYIEPTDTYLHIDIPDDCGRLVDADKAVKEFIGLSDLYNIALQDCELEKEVYPHIEALWRGKKAIVDLGIKIMTKAPVVIKEVSYD